MLMTSKLHMLTFLTCHWFSVTWIFIGRFPKAFLVVFEFPNEVKGFKTSQPEAFPFAKKENKANGLSETENKANFTVYKINSQRFGNFSVQLKCFFNTCGRFSSKVLVSELVFCIVRESVSMISAQPQADLHVLQSM